MVDAGLVPPCVEKLVQEDSTELKVQMLLCMLYSAICTPCIGTGTHSGDPPLVFPGGHSTRPAVWGHTLLPSPPLPPLCPCAGQGRHPSLRPHDPILWEGGGLQTQGVCGGSRQIATRRRVVCAVTVDGSPHEVRHLRHTWCVPSHCIQYCSDHQREVCSAGSWGHASPHLPPL